MAITFVLVSRGSNHLVYLASSEGGAQGLNDIGIIQATGVGAADVSLQAAAVPSATDHYSAGLLKEIVNIQHPVGPSLAGVAARQMLDWGLGGPPAGFASIISVQGKRCRAYIVPVLPTGGEVLKDWAIDAVLDSEAPDHGEYSVECSEVGTARALIVIEAIGTPQQF